MAQKSASPLARGTRVPAECVCGGGSVRPGIKNGGQGLGALTLEGVPACKAPWDPGKGPSPVLVAGLALPLLLWPSMSAAAPGSPAWLPWVLAPAPQLPGTSDVISHFNLLRI